MANIKKNLIFVIKFFFFNFIRAVDSWIPSQAEDDGAPEAILIN